MHAFSCFFSLEYAIFACILNDGYYALLALYLCVYAGFCISGDS